MPAYEGYVVGTPETLVSHLRRSPTRQRRSHRPSLHARPEPLPDNVTEIPVERGPMVYNQALADEIAAKQTASEATPSPTPAEATPPPPK